MRNIDNELVNVCGKQSQSDYDFLYKNDIMSLAQNTYNQLTQACGTKIVTKSKPVLLTLFSVFVLSLISSIFLLFNPVFIAPTNLTSIADNYIDSNGIRYKIIEGTQTASAGKINTSLTSGDITILSEITINGVEYSVTSISASAFYSCRSLTNLVIPNSITTISDSAFRDCYGLTTINIPNSVNAFSVRLFWNCKGLTSITIPSSITIINSYVFDGCSALQSISIPRNVINIGVGILSACPNVTRIEVDANNSVYKSVDNCLLSKDGTQLIMGCKESSIPNGVTNINPAAFSGCSGLTSVDIPDGVTIIGDSAFSGCSGLTSIEIPSSVVTIGTAFSGCSGIESIIVDQNNLGYQSINDYCILNKTGDTFVLGCKKASIPSGVTNINPAAFAGCTGLTSITIPNGVTTIGSSAFYNCSGLTSIEIPNGVTSIGSNAFNSCHGLTSVTIPGSVISIGQGAFRACNGLTDFILCEGVSVIGYLVLSNSYQLANIEIPSSVISIDSISDSKYVANFVANATSKTFATNSEIIGLRVNDKFRVGNDVNNYIYYQVCSDDASKYICYGGSSSCLIKNVANVSGDLEIARGTVFIPSSAFSGCIELTSITIPSTVTTIGNSAFANCTGLISSSINLPTKSNTHTYQWYRTISGTKGNYVYSNAYEMPVSLTTIGLSTAYAKEIPNVESAITISNEVSALKSDMAVIVQSGEYVSMFIFSKNKASLNISLLNIPQGTTYITFCAIDNYVVTATKDGAVEPLPVTTVDGNYKRISFENTADTTLAVTLSNPA